MQKVVKNNSRALMKVGLFLMTIAGVCFAGMALAQPSGASISEIAKNVNGSVSSLATILSDIALIAGIGFVMASFFKFHQHKLNPTQVPLSQGITLLMIGAGLMLFPAMLPTATKAVFGSKGSIAHVGGSGINQLIGGDTK